jgi:predicted ATPase
MSNAVSLVGIIPVYRARVASGDIISDPAQLRAAEHLQNLWAKLRGYDPHPKAPPNGRTTPTASISWVRSGAVNPC